ncbi:hypothetical protein MTO96_011209 [Rhipicephalus appendiculatus]
MKTGHDGRLPQRSRLLQRCRLKTQRRVSCNQLCAVTGYHSVRRHACQPKRITLMVATDRAHGAGPGFRAPSLPSWIQDRSVARTSDTVEICAADWLSWAKQANVRGSLSPRLLRALRQAVVRETVSLAGVPLRPRRPGNTQLWFTITANAPPSGRPGVLKTPKQTADSFPDSRCFPRQLMSRRQGTDAACVRLLSNKTRNAARVASPGPATASPDTEVIGPCRRRQLEIAPVVPERSDMGRRRGSCLLGSRPEVTPSVRACPVPRTFVKLAISIGGVRAWRHRQFAALEETTASFCSATTRARSNPGVSVFKRARLCGRAGRKWIALLVVPAA